MSFVKIPLIFSGVLLSLSLFPAHSATVFSTIPSSLGNSYDSHAFKASGTDILGNYVQLASTERYLTAITVTMVTHALAADYPTYVDPVGWTHDLTLVLYSVGSGSAPSLTPLATKTNTNQLIPWKPTTLPTQGMAFNVNFTFDGYLQIPNQLLIGVTYKTQGHGLYASESDPEITVNGPYNSLNVGWRTTAPTVGSEVLLDNPSTPENDPTDYVYIGNDSGSTLYGQSGGRNVMMEISATHVLFDNLPRPDSPNIFDDYGGNGWPGHLLPTLSGYPANMIYAAEGFQASTLSEAGDIVQLSGGGGMILSKATIGMANYGTNSFAHPITLNLWSVTYAGSSYTRGAKLATKTVTVSVPAAVSGQGSRSFLVVFDLTDLNLTVPVNGLLGYSVTYNTQSYGPNPIGSDGPFNSLNYGVTDVLTNDTRYDVVYGPYVGVDVEPGKVLFDDGAFSSSPDYVSQADGHGYNGMAGLFRLEAQAGPATPYDNWIVSYGYTVGAAPALRSADPDGDGLSNLAEFVFGLDPTANSPNPITIARSNTTVTVSWLQRNDGSATYTNRSTTNLTTGFPAGNSTNFAGSLSSDTNNLPSTNYSRYQFSTNVSAFLRHFYKVDAAEVQ